MKSIKCETLVFPVNIKMADLWSVHTLVFDTFDSCFNGNAGNNPIVTRT